MKRPYVVGVLFLWFAIGFVNFGLTLGYGNHRCPWQSNIGDAIFSAAGGPLAFPAVLLMDRPFHWSLHTMGVEERWKAFQKRWPSLADDREFFERTLN